MMENIPIERNYEAHCARCYGDQLLAGIGNKFFGN